MLNCSVMSVLGHLVMMGLSSKEVVAVGRHVVSTVLVEHLPDMMRHTIVRTPHSLSTVTR